MAQAQMVRPPEGLFSPPRRADTLADLFANIWQLGYVTNDLDRAIERMATTFGLTHCAEVPTAGARFLAGEREAEWRTRIAMGSRGGTIIELIEPLGGEVDLYRRLLPADGSFAVRLHHLATFVANDEEEWRRVCALLAQADLRVDYTVLIPGRVRAGYVDTTAILGHWLEICQLQREDTDFFNSLVTASA